MFRTFHAHTTMLNAHPTIIGFRVLGLPVLGLFQILHAHITILNAHSTIFCFRVLALRVLGLFRTFHAHTTMAGLRFYRIQLNAVITLHTQLNKAHLYMATTRHRTTLNVHNSIQHNSTRHNSTRHNSTRPQLNTPQLYTDHMTVWLKLLYSSERYEQSVNVITLRQKSRNTNDTFVRTVRYSIVASTLRPCGLCL